MYKSSFKTPRWSTSSSGATPDESPKEIAALKKHLQRCTDAREPLFELKSRADAVALFAAPRLMTILIAFTIASVIASLLI